MGTSQSSVLKAELALCIRTGDKDSLLKLMHEHPELLGGVVERQSGSNAMHLAVVSGHGGRTLVALLSLLQPTQGALDPKLELQLREGALKALRGCNKEGLTPLMLACDIGDVDCVRALLQAGADPWERCSHHRRTCLHFAAAGGHVDVMKEVIHHNVTVAAVDTHPGLSLLRHILHELPPPLESRLLVDAPCSAGFTPTMLAALHNHPHALNLLYQSGAAFKLRCWGLYVPGDRMSRTCPDGSSALHVAALYNCLHAAKAILRQYAESLGPGGAAYYEQRAHVDGTPVDPRRLVDCEGRTPFAVARLMRHHSLVRLLNPVTPLATALRGGTHGSSRIPAVERLAHIAGKAVQQLLLSQVQELRARLQQRRQEQQLAQPQQPGQQPQQQPGQQLQQQPGQQPRDMHADGQQAFNNGPLPDTAAVPAAVNEEGSAHGRRGRSRPLPVVSLRRFSSSLLSSVAGGPHPGPAQRPQSHQLSPPRASTLAQQRTPSSSSQSYAELAGLGGDPGEQLQGALEATRFHRLTHGIASHCDLSALPAVAPAGFAACAHCQGEGPVALTCPPTLLTAGITPDSNQQQLQQLQQPARHQQQQPPLQQQQQGHHSRQQSSQQQCRSQQLPLPALHREGSGASAPDAPAAQAAPPLVSPSYRNLLVPGLQVFLEVLGSHTHQGHEHAAPTPAGAPVGPTQGGANGSEDPDGLCGVCLDVGDFLTIQSCSHKICAECALELVKLHSRTLLPCPFCRGTITGFALAGDQCC